MDEITKTVINLKEALESKDMYVPDTVLESLVNDNYWISDMPEWTFADFASFASDVCAEGYKEAIRQWGLT